MFSQSAIISPRSQKELVEVINRLGSSGGKLSICGGRNSMGGQQFGADTTLVDLRSMNDALHFDR